jgi:predicted RNA methylase
MPGQRVRLVDVASLSDQFSPEDVPLPGCLASALRRGRRPSDRVFDRLLPDSVRRASGRYWTPLAVAMRAAEWLRQLNVSSVADIGSGAGKFCVATALTLPARFTGVEQRPQLVAAARELACTFALEDRVTFIEGRFGDAPLDAEAYYLYNPFGENLYGPDDQLDDKVELSGARFFDDIERVEQMLRDAVVGTCVLTYNGFGGQIPACYREIYVDRALPNVLRLWRKTNRLRTVRPDPMWSVDSEPSVRKPGRSARHKQRSA